MMGLTTRQAEALAYIKEHVDRHGCAPTFGEMLSGLGLASKSNVHRVLMCLERRGHIRRLHGQARAIEVLTPAPEADLFRQVDRMDSATRRRLIALAAGLQASDDGDGGVQAAAALYRIADRLLGKPRRAAA